MLILYSAFLIQIAIIHVNDLCKNQVSKLSETPAVIAILCTVFQVVSGVASLVTGMAVMHYNSHRTATTIVSIVLNLCVLAYAGSFDFFQLYYQGPFWVSVPKLMFLSFCLALPGGTLVCMARLVYLQPGNNSAFRNLLFQQASSLYTNAIFLNAILFWAGIATTLRNYWLGAENISSMMVVTGLMMAIGAIWGILIVVRRERRAQTYSAYSALMIVVAVLNLSIIQPALVEHSSSGSDIVHFQQVLTTVSLGPYFTHILLTQGPDASGLYPL